MLKMRPKSSYRSEQDGLFVWTVFIVFLAGFAVLCWVGSFYVFGHPEKAFSYRLLRKLGKIDEPKRFELTSAPRGKFLDANELFERYGSVSAGALAAENDKLLRNYISNYYQTKLPVSYAIGPFHIMGAFRLGPGNFFTEGVVALAESTDNPKVLLELVFPAAPENTVDLERMLMTGLDIKLVKTLDLTAVLNARVMTDGRLILTVVPLLYGNYTSSSSNGTFSLSPPEQLNVDAGLPVLNQAAVSKADQHYRSYLERAGLAPKDDAPILVRVQAPEAASPGTSPPIRRAEAIAAPKPSKAPLADGEIEMLGAAGSADAAEPVNAPQPDDTVPVARAIAVATPEPTVARAIPVATPEPTVARAIPVSPTPTPEPEGTPTAELQPLEAAAPATISATGAAPTRKWSVYEPGKMPRGRLVDVSTAPDLIGRSNAEKTYLGGNFNVRASGPGRAVLRGQGAAKNVRVVVDFPDGTTPPAEGENFRRDNQRPFEITRVEKGADGQVNVYVREVTRP